MAEQTKKRWMTTDTTSTRSENPKKKKQTRRSDEANSLKRKATVSQENQELQPEPTVDVTHAALSGYLGSVLLQLLFILRSSRLQV